MATRKTLLEAARQVFADKGFLNADIGEVAEIAGKSRATVYNYVSGKTELLLGLIAQFRADVVGLPAVNGAILLKHRRAILRRMWDIYDRHAVTLDALNQAATIDPRFAAEQRDIQQRGVENCRLLFGYQQEQGRCRQYDANVAGLILAIMINSTIQKVIAQRNDEDLPLNFAELAFENLVKMVEAIIFDEPAGQTPRPDRRSSNE